MAVAINTQAIISFSGASPVTVSYTVATGTNQVLVVSILSIPTSITYAGANMIMAVSLTSRSIWYLVNPATGANNFVVTGSTGSIANHGVIVLTGVHQATPIDTTGSSTITTAASSSTSLTVKNTGSALVDFLTIASTATGITASNGQNTLVVGQSGTTGNNGVKLGLTSGTASYGYTWATSVSGIYVAAAFNAANSLLLNNYQQFKVGDGMSTGEKIR